MGSYQNIDIGVVTTKEELDRFAKEFPFGKIEVDDEYIDENGYAEFHIRIIDVIDVDYIDDAYGRYYFYDNSDVIKEDDIDTIKEWLNPYNFELDYIKINDVGYTEDVNIWENY